MSLFSVHLSPQSSWPLLLVGTLAIAALAVWAYRFRLPPLPARLRAALSTLRLVALLVLLWLLGQPVLERPRPGQRPRVVALVDRSASMALPGEGGEPRAAAAQRAVAALQRSLRGRATVTVMGFASRLEAAGDTASLGPETALGAALVELSRRPESQDLGAVVVVSDGVVNAGPDPQAAAAALGVPVHAALTASAPAPDRAVLEVESSPTARVGEPAPLRVHMGSDEPRGERLPLRVLSDGRVVARADAVSPGPGAEVVVEVRVTPAAPGLALYTARVDSLGGELTASNNARSVAVEVLPGRLGVMVLTSGLNWDLAFLRRALLGDSALAVATWARGGAGWRALDGTGRSGPPAPAALRRQSVVVLDGLAPGAMGSDLQEAIIEAVRAGTGLLLLGGDAPPGLARYRGGQLGDALAPPLAGLAPLSASPQPDAGAHDLLAWDEDAARGERAWRAAAPLAKAMPLSLAGGDRVLVGGVGEGPPLLVARRVGRGQVLLVNGTGFWRWGMVAGDALAAQRSERLWRRLVRWLAEPAQGEPLRVRPERLLTSRGERPRLVATLQDQAFRPVSGARVDAEVTGGAGSVRTVAFAPQSPGSYAASLPELPPGIYQVRARASRGGSELGRGQTRFAVDRWSLEEARAHADSAALARVAGATGGSFARASDAGAWARGIVGRAKVVGRVESVRLWEWPWTFALLVAVLGAEWFARRKRGLP